MSRIGKAPIAIPAKVEVSIAPNNVVTVKGPRGSLHQRIDPDIIIEKEGNEILVKRPTDSKRHRSMHGLLSRIAPKIAS